MPVTSKDAIVGAVTVIRCQPARGDDCPAVKFVWTIDGWNAQTFPANGKVTVDLESRPVTSEEAGIRGDGSWTFSIVGEKGNSSVGVYLRHLGTDREHIPQVQLITVVRTANPSVVLPTICDDMTDTLNFEHTGGGMAGVAEDFWTARTAVVEVTVTFTSHEFIAESASPIPPETDFMLGNYMRDSYMSSNASDATLISSDQKEVKCHRSVLSAHSDVFKAMFEHDTIEKKTGVCNITDICHAPLKVFVDALYGLKVDGRLVEIAEDVFTAADKYQVQHVKRRCVESMEESIAIGNSVERLTFAKANELDGLATKVVEFVNENYADFVASDRMDDMLKQPKAYRKEFFEVLRPKDAKKRSAEEAEL